MTRKAKPIQITCRECGVATAAGCGEHRRDAKFCSIPCKTKWNNRKKTRGADIYELWMAMRYERDEAKRLGLWGELCRLSEGWYQEDQRERGGRKTYGPPAEVLTRLRENGSIRIGDIVGNYRALGVKR